MPDRLTPDALRAALGERPLRCFDEVSSTACPDYFDGYWSVKWVLHRELAGPNGDAGEG